MAQPLQPYGTNPAAEETLRISEAQRQQPGMGRTAAPVGPNLMDGGATSKPNVNAQPYNNARLMGQNQGQNASTAVPGQQVKAVSDMRVAAAEQNDKIGKAQEFKNREVANFLYANDMGNATFQMGIPEVAQRTQQHVMEQAQISAGTTNPQVAFTSNRLPIT